VRLDSFRRDGQPQRTRHHENRLGDRATVAIVVRRNPSHEAAIDGPVFSAHRIALT
jgi:hypothetical protein